MPLADLNDLIASGQFVGLREWPGYGVSTDGRVWSCKIQWAFHVPIEPTWRELKLNSRKANRYFVVTIYRDRKKHQFLVHRLILETFVGPCPPGMVGCHSDDNPINNNLDNLRWDWPSENSYDAMRNGRYRRGDAHPHTKLKEADIPLIRELRSIGVDIDDIADQFGVSRTLIYHILSGKIWSHVP